MQAQRIGHALGPEIGRLQPPEEPACLQRKDRIQPEIEGIEPAGRIVRLEPQPGEIAGLLHNGKIPGSGKAVQAKWIGLSAMANLAVAGPADHGEEDRGGLRPYGRIGLPKKIDAVARPGQRLGAARGDL